MGDSQAVQPLFVEVGVGPSSHSLFECRQHAVRPDARVHPVPHGRGLSGGTSRIRHYLRFVISFPALGHLTSTFLHPFAPPALPGFIATLGALHPAWRALRLYEREHPPVSTQVYLLTAFDLPTIPSPTTALPFRHGRFHTLLHRRDLPCLSPGQTSKVGGIAVARSRVRTSLGASPTGLAESSSLALRTGHSSQVALHLSSQKRSYHFRLQAGNVSLRGTFTLLIKRLHRRTSLTLRVGSVVSPSPDYSWPHTNPTRKRGRSHRLPSLTRRVSVQHSVGECPGCHE